MNTLKPETQKAISYMHRRATLLCGLTADPRALHSARDTLELNAKATADVVKAAEEKMKKLLARSREGDREAKRELAELRIQTVDLYIRATSGFAASFFTEVNLTRNQEPVWKNTYKSPVRVKFVGEDGGVQTTKPVRAQKHTPVELQELAPDEIEYPMRDLQTGEDVAAASQATVDVAWDLQRMMDKQAKTLLDTLYGDFNTGSAKLDKTWLAHPDIVTANLPTTNELVCTGNSGSTKFRSDVFVKIINYCESWGQALKMPLMPTGVIYVPSKDITDMASEFTPSGSTSNVIADGILKDYRRFEYMGINWVLIPDVTLASGKCYPVLNMPVGEIYNKPEFAQEWVESYPKINLEKRGMTRPWAISAPEAWRIRTCRVTYHS